MLCLTVGQFTQLFLFLLCDFCAVICSRFLISSLPELVNNYCIIISGIFWFVELLISPCDVILFTSPPSDNLELKNQQNISRTFQCRNLQIAIESLKFLFYKRNQSIKSNNAIRTLQKSRDILNDLYFIEYFLKINKLLKLINFQ